MKTRSAAYQPGDYTLLHSHHALGPPSGARTYSLACRVSTDVGLHSVTTWEVKLDAEAVTLEVQ